MANLRVGKYTGEYYGSYFDESEPLTNEEMHLNAVYVYQILKYIYGWSDNACAGLIGNLQAESSINPGRWQGDNVGVGPAYGLVQWDPFTKYTDWCTSEGRTDPSEMDNNIERIIYEVENNIQYYSTADYPESFVEFTQSTASPYYLACAFAWNYERSWVVLYGTEEEKENLRQLRGENANYWYTYLTSNEPPEPVDPTPTKKKKKMPVWMMLKQY